MKFNGLWTRCSLIGVLGLCLVWLGLAVGSASGQAQPDDAKATEAEPAATQTPSTQTPSPADTPDTSPAPASPGREPATPNDEPSSPTASPAPSPQGDAATPGLSAAALRDALSMDPLTGTLPTVLELFKTSIIINSIILALSVLALLMFLYFFLTISSRSLAPPSFIGHVEKLIYNQQYREALHWCRAKQHVFVASIILRCLENAGKAHSVILDILDAEGRRRADLVWNRISYLADIANIAPMLGLLGTVMGMIKTFFSEEYVRNAATGPGTSLLTAGIGEAMATTMFGLIVAIVALFFHSVIKSRATKALGEAERKVHELADHIKRGAA